MGLSKSVEGGTVQGISAHPVVDQRVNAPAELVQLGVDAVEDRVLQIEDAVREHGTVTLGIGRLLRWRLALGCAAPPAPAARACPACVRPACFR